ncbi:TIGR03620 family F420-dependent LLM class oxidoreductase [Arthrobacter sp. zg-Y826]|uniref:TIGR03620 family F420-dependent LLM class oxidoreductase n=1 Tax=Arthrobacter jinronghuae TaxID=2964609 RepID=UPI002107A0D5|nr:TIGR03620 family F420-dependent LLM class oxidoreductase [Arthrobacter jinronghuae]MCQ1957569.1 TIGR03620 family F420-dependent LLM class oxidoreductase [Arthrobacter jinronghuae]
MNSTPVDLGSVGIWSIELGGAEPATAAEAAAELHSQGWGAIWLVGAGGHGLWDSAERILQAGTQASVAFGVLSIWGRDAEIASGEHGRLTRTFGPRVLSGFGVSNPHAAAAVGKDFTTPVREMNRFLDMLDRSTPTIPQSQRLLGALGPRMVELAGRRAVGIHPFLVTAESNALNRESIGADALIAPHLGVVLEEDPARARQIARAGVGMFIGFPAYQANLRRLGFTDADLVPGGSDRLIDATVAWGSVDQIADRIAEHHAAGADHVALHVMNGQRGLPTAQWRELAPLARR